MNLRPARRLAFFSSLLALFCSANVLADAPGLDSSFGIGGRVAVELGAYGSRANAVAVQPDGKIVVAGSSASAAGKDFMLFRLLPDGSLDAAFGANGTVSAAVSAVDDEALSLVLQADGKIIAAGYSVNDDKNRDFAMIRCNADGSLDNTFGMGGVAVTAVGSSHDEITDVTVQADGGIVITGSALDSSGHQVVVLGRYLADGNPDLSFAEDGFALSIVGFDAQAESVLTDADGRILVSGSYSDSRRTGLMLLGFTADGRLDSNFGVNGIAVPADSSTFSEGYSMFIQADGKVLVAGSVGREGERDAALFRFVGDGGPDSGFGAQGVVVTAASAEDDALYDAAVIGKTIAATGFKTVAGTRAFLLITYAAAQDNPAQLSATVADVGFSDGEETPTALAAASSSSLVMVGQSGADPKSSALVGKYSMAALDEAASTVGRTETGNQYILTGQPYDVTRTTATIPAKILAGLGSVTKRGVVFGTAPNPVIDGSGGGDVGEGPVRSNLSPKPSGTVSGTSTTLGLNTDVAAVCKYSTTAGTAYDRMENDFTAGSGGKTHFKLVSSLTVGEKKYAVRCKNTATGSVNTTDEFITFTVKSGGSAADVTPPVVTDTTAPIITNDTSANFNAGIEVAMFVKTQESAQCKYNKDIDADYDVMNNEFPANAGGINHSTNLGKLSAGTYDYYVRCKDDAGNKNTSGIKITFTVAAATVNNSTDSGQLDAALQNVSSLFVSTAFAQTSGDTSTSGTSTSTATNSSAADSTTATNSSNSNSAADTGFLEKGSSSDGSGTGSFSSQLKNLKPGTFFYARAYAVIGGAVYYGNQVTLQTADSCFVATAAFGSVFHPSVQVLRDFRDRFLTSNALGRSLVALYYQHSPTAADFIRERGSLRYAVRLLLLPVTGAAWTALQLGPQLTMLLPAPALLAVALLLTGWLLTLRGQRKD